MIFQAGMNFFLSNFNNMGKTNQIYRGREIAHGTLRKCNLLRKMMRGDSGAGGVGVCELQLLWASIFSSLKREYYLIQSHTNNMELVSLKSQLEQANGNSNIIVCYE